jgi:hypothetical protein
MSERPPESVLWNLGGRERDEEQWRVLVVGQLGSRADAELAVDLGEVELDRLRRQEERGAGLAVRGPLGDEERDLELLRGQLVRSRRPPGADGDAGGGEFGPRAAHPGSGVELQERRVRGPEVGACLGAAAEPA